MRSRSATVLHPLDASWDDLATAYHIDDPDATRVFMDNHPTMPKLLLEIREAARRYFGDDPMAVEIFIDPESEESEPELVAVVKTRRKGNVALDLLHAFDREWRLPRFNGGRSPILLAFDLV